MNCQLYIYNYIRSQLHCPFQIISILINILKFYINVITHYNLYKYFIINIPVTPNPSQIQDINQMSNPSQIQDINQMSNPSQIQDINQMSNPSQMSNSSQMSNFS